MARREERWWAKIKDEEDILALMHYNLTKEGYQVIGALSGEEGLEFLRERKPDLIRCCRGSAAWTCADN